MLIGRTPSETAKLILEFQSKAIKIRTWPAIEYGRKFLAGADYNFLLAQARLDKNRHASKAAQETLPLIREYAQSHNVQWFRPLGPLQVVLSKNLIVPVKPIGMVGVDGKVVLLAGQVWKNISPNAYQFRVWASITKLGVIDNNPDLSGFHWLEMSAPRKNSDRELSVRTLDTIDLLTDSEFASVVANIEEAMEIVRSTPKPNSEKKKPDDRQSSLFED